MELELIIEKLIAEPNVVNIIEFGSKVYGTNTKKSDTDYIIIVDTHREIVNPEISYGDKDCHFYSLQEWKQMCAIHDIRCLEAYFTDYTHYLKGGRFDFFENGIDYDLVRIEVSRVASNSWVKCKKKLTVERDYNPYIAKKSLFHSLRILEFGRQIMKFGGIYDFKSANIYFNEIMSYNDDWEELKEKYQPIYNELKTQFKKAHREREIRNVK